MYLAPQFAIRTPSAGPYGLAGLAPRRRCACRHARRRRVHISRLGFLGQTVITPQEALTQAMSGYSSPDFQNATWLAAAAADVQNMNIPVASFSPACAGIIAKNPDLSLTQAAGSIAGASTGAVAAAAAGTTAGAVLGVATFGIGIVVAILSAIFAHHAQAVTQEQDLGCVGIAGANNSFAVISQGVQAGSIAPADASTALNTVLSQAQNYMNPSIKNNPCNADCEAYVLIKAIVLYMQSQFEVMAEAAVASTPTAAQIAANPLTAITTPITNEVANVSASTGLPSLAIWAGLAFLAYELVK
jgi:hypothetical protein